MFVCANPPKEANATPLQRHAHSYVVVCEQFFSPFRLFFSSFWLILFACHGRELRCCDRSHSHILPMHTRRFVAIFFSWQINTFLLCIIKSHSACRWCLLFVRAPVVVVGARTSTQGNRNEIIYKVRDLFGCTRAIHRIVFRSSDCIRAFQLSSPSRLHSLHRIGNAINSNKPRIVWMQPRERLPNTICYGTKKRMARLSRERRWRRIRLPRRTFLIVLHFAMKMVLNFDVLQFMSILWTFGCERTDSQNGRKICTEWKLFSIN